jgi:hypothetical protein
MGEQQSGGLQFDRAAAAGGAGAVSCSSCQRTIPDVYYEAGGRVLCTGCKDATLATVSGGSRVGRLLSASLLGLAAAAVSAVGWYAISHFTGYEIGLIALVVGLVVGGAVKVGSKGRGGWLYQALAVVLTYAAIATSYVPPFVAGFREAAAQEAAAAESAAEEMAPETKEAAMWVMAVLFAFAWPVLQVTEGGFIGTLIVGFALYQAWKMNRREGSGLTGPFQVQAAAS